MKSLLAAPESELRLVTQRYAIDRSTLNGNYDGSGRAGGRGGRGNPGGGGGGGTDGRAGRGTDPAPTTATSLSLSPNRIARLKRYDASWQAALARLDTNKLSAAAKTDLETLKATIQSNLAELDADATKIAQVMPLVPFAPAIIKLNETRIRLEDVKSQEAAGILTDLTREITKIKSRVEAGLTGATTPDAMKVSKDLATRGADAVDGLRNSVTTWFNFYNTYDPLFTWWMGMPYKQVDTALGDYAGFLRDKVAPADLITTPAPLAALAPGTVPAIKNNEVPDLQEIIALPQDEMRGIVQRFIGVSGGRAGRGATSSPGSGRPRQFYLDWMAALKTLDFDALSRNGQVDYLFIKNACERQIARLDFVPEANPPRKTDNSGIPGAARGRAGLVMDLADEMIPYSPEQLIALANKEFAWQEEEMKKASRQMGFGDDWKRAVEKVKGMYVQPGQQPAVVRDMLFEAVDYLRAKDLVTVPQIASESLHMSMMSPEAQLSAPFFLGGSQILVSYPTNTMEYDARMQSMRGNNIPFSHAVAFHEMIPGHNLVGYMGSRFANYRARHRWQHAVLRRRLAALLGADPLRHGLPRYAGGTGWRALLAHASLRPYHLFAQLPHGQVVAAGGYRLPGREGGTRARQRDGRGQAFVSGWLRSALPGGLPARRAAAARAAQGSRRQQADDEQAVPRRDPAPGQHADCAHPAGPDQAEAHARHERRLEVLRRFAGVGGAGPAEAGRYTPDATAI